MPLDRVDEIMAAIAEAEAKREAQSNHVIDKLGRVADGLEDTAYSIKLMAVESKLARESLQDKVPLKLVFLLVFLSVVGFAGANALTVLLDTLARAHASGPQ